MIAETLSVGTELLLGQTVDTNATYLAGIFSSLGVDCYYRSTVGDNPDRMRLAMEAALSRSDVLVTIGGLGPTMDDLTKEIACEVMDVPLAMDEAERAKLTDMAASRGFVFPPSFLKQAMLPAENGGAVPNPVGTAPGVYIEKNGKIVICLPGPPNEFIPMVNQSVVPLLAAQAGIERTVIRSRILRVIGLGESTVEERVKDLMAGSNPTLAPYAKLGECHLRITARASTESDADDLIAPMQTDVRTRLGDALYGVDDESLEVATVRLLAARSRTVATAESCTGGLLASRITSVPGASAVLGTGTVTYSNDAKVRMLGVSQETLDSFGAVSAETAREMALGIRASSGASFGISITGVAGPDGGTADKPVGLVYIGLSAASGVVAVKSQFGGSRRDIQYRASQTALMLLRRLVLDNGQLPAES